MASLYNDIKKICDRVEANIKEIRAFAKSKGVYARIDDLQEKGKAVEQWLEQQYGIYNPEVSIINFNSVTGKKDWNWTLENFKQRERTDLRCDFKMSVDNKNKVTIQSYEEYRFKRAWRWAFKSEFEHARTKTFATTNKAEFTATDAEIEAINTFNIKYGIWE